MGVQYGYFVSSRIVYHKIVRKYFIKHSDDFSFVEDTEAHFINDNGEEICYEFQDRMLKLYIYFYIVPFYF